MVKRYLHRRERSLIQYARQAVQRVSRNPDPSGGEAARDPLCGPPRTVPLCAAGAYAIAFILLLFFQAQIYFVLFLDFHDNKQNQFLRLLYLTHPQPIFLCFQHFPL
jgi:hypothetical protein